MDEKVRRRRRLVQRERGQGRALVVLLVVLALAGVGIFVWLRSADVLAVERVTVTPVKHVSLAQVAEVTATYRGRSLLRISVDKVAQQLSALPYVRSATVHRRFPDTLEVQLEEYEACARVKGGDGAVYLAAVDGKILARGEVTSDPSQQTGAGAGEEVADLPLIIPTPAPVLKVGSFAPAVVRQALPVAVALRTTADETGGAGAEERVFSNVAKVVVQESGDVVLVLQTGTEVRLGEPTNLEAKLTVATAVLKRYLKANKELLYVDVRSPERVAVKEK